LKPSELEPCTGRKYQATIWFTYDKVSYVKIRAYDSKNIIRTICMLELWPLGKRAVATGNARG